MHWEIPLVGWKVNPVVVALFFGAVFIYKLFTRKKYNAPPGPFALPIVGNLIQLYFSKEKLFKTCAGWSKDYGPIFTLYLGTRRCVVINNIELALEATVKNPTDFAGRPYFPSGDYISMGGKDIVLANFGPTWKLHRKISYHAMRNYASGQNLETKVHKAFESVANLLETLNEPIKPLHHLSLMVFNFICGFCWGQSYHFEDAEFNTLMQLSDKLNNDFANGLPEDLVPILRHFPSSRRTKMLAAIKQFYDIIFAKYEQHRDTFNPDEIRDFIDDLLLARSEAEKEEKKDVLDQLTDTHLFLTITDIFGAGTDTSRFTLLWAVYCMVKYPDVQHRVQKEIDTVVGRGRLPGLQDREKLAYTEGTLQEVMRIVTIVPMGVPHSAMVDSSLGGYDIRKDTMIFFNTWAIHMDPNHWIEPQKFDPCRFLNPDGSHAPKPLSFFPFSAGRRVCLGEAVAKPELLILFACLMQRFTYTLPPGTQLPTNDMPGALANLPSDDFEVVVKPRY